LFPQFLQLDRGQVAKRTVETFMIVFASPVLKENLRLEERLEELAVEKLVA
jgi:hypothetical protein